jgi:hypothetical protein
MTTLISKDIVDLQDIEKIQFMKTLQADPAKYSAYVNEKSGRILSETVDTKRASFVKASGDMARMMDMNHNSMAALVRSGELINTQNHVIREQERATNILKLNKDVSRRQIEINEWYYENKRETLFVLQLVLIVMLMMVIIMGFHTYGFLNQQSSNLLLSFTLLVGAGVWVYRWYYTSYVRDARYWSQRTFPEDGDASPPDACPGKEEEDTEPVLLSMSDYRALSVLEKIRYARSLSSDQVASLRMQYGVISWKEYNALGMIGGTNYAKSLRPDQQAALWLDMAATMEPSYILGATKYSESLTPDQQALIWLDLVQGPTPQSA